MILRDGYIMTELGELPVDWVINSLKDTAKVVTGKTPATQNPMFWGGNIPWITPSDIDGQRDIFTSERMLSAEGFSNNPAKLPPNTILVTCIASIGKNAITRTISSCNQQINAILPSPKYISEFLYYWISNNKDYYVSNAAKTAVMILNKSTFENLPVVLPPLREQQKIADILFTVDDHISETEFLIEKTKVLKQGMLQRLLTKGIGHTDFKDTEIGRIPVEWSVVKFSTLVLFQEGPGLRKWQYTTSGIPFLNIRCIQNNSIDRRSIQFISIEEYESKYKHFSLNSGDLVVSSSGTLGKKAIIKTSDLPLMLNTSIIRMKTLDEKRLSMSFLNYFVESDFYQKAVTQESVGSAQANYGPYHLNKIDIILPPIEEQHRIASILTAIDDQIDSYQTKLTTLTKLKSALMQQLLTGKIRVKI